MGHELYENDQMFSVKEVPWHGLGNILDHPPTVEEAIRVSELDWKVYTEPVYRYFNEKDEIDEVPAQVMIRDDGGEGEVLGVVGPSYVPLQNVEAFNVFEPLIDSGELLLETAGSLKGGRKVWILARIAVDGKDVMKGDEVRPYVLLSNSHDGTQAVRIGYTPIRVVCWNTLSASVNHKESKLIKVVHRGNVKENVEALRETMNLFKATFEASAADFKFLSKKSINSDDLKKYVRIVVSPNKTDLTFDDEPITRTENRIVELFETGVGSNLHGDSWWGAYNAINEYLMYEKGRSADNRLDSVWFGLDRKTNDFALETALKMAG